MSEGKRGEVGARYASRAVWLLALSASAGQACKIDTSPFDGLGSDPCAPGNLRPTSQACVMPAAPEDGGATDWSQLETIPVAASCTGTCEPRPTGIQLVQLSSASYGPGFEVHVILDSPPPTSDGTVRYVLRMSPLSAYPAATSDTLAFGASGTTYAKSGAVVNPGEPVVLPYSAAWSSDGLFAWVPRALVATRAGVQLGVGMERLEGTTWTSVLAPSATVLACWEPDAIVTDPCRGGQ